MAEAVTVDRPPVAKPVARQRSSVSASALAQHLDCSRAYIGKLEADGVIQRQGDGFPLDASRVAYLRFLRRERRQSPRGEADADFQRAKAELIRLRIAEKQRALVRREDVDELIDTMAGTVLTHLSGMAARCTRDLAVRRAIDNVVDQVRREIARRAARWRTNAASHRSTSSDAQRASHG